MSLQPDRLFLQSATLIYFSGWLWLAYSIRLFPVRSIAQRPLAFVIGLTLSGSTVIWGYLIISILIETGINPFRLSLTTEFLLIMALAASYFPLKPWHGTLVASIPPLVRMARLELIGLLVVIPIGSMFLIAPIGVDILGWLPSLIDTNTVLCGVVATLAIVIVLVSDSNANRYAFLFSTGIMLMALATTYIVMVTALVATI